MIEKIDQLLEEIKQFSITNSEELEKFRLRYLSKKGIVNDLFSAFKTVTPAEKPLVGKKINELKEYVQQKFQQAQHTISDTSDHTSGMDKTLPGYPVETGSRHPIALVKNEIVSIFSRVGFTISEGPEIEDDDHVFTKLNFPPDHPARDMQDTFFIEKNPDILLRTHTSSVQVRVMMNEKPPIRTISPGRVFRNEAISARSHCIFHQIEGLYIDTDVSFADLKQTLLFFAKEFFGEDTQIRLRPSFFPFTEPSGEMDISCKICGGKGCNVCKYTGWVEILGCGMVDPNVLDSCHIDSKKYTGYAFGMGIERIAMLKYQIKDIRLFFENDIRFLNQFRKAF